MVTVGASHVTAAFVLLDADVAFATVFGVSIYVVGSFRVMSTFHEPFPDCGIVCGGMIHLTTLETEDLIALIGLYLASSGLPYPNNEGAICTRAQLELVMTLHIVPEEVDPVFVSQFFIRQQWRNEVLWCLEWMVLSYAKDSHTHAIQVLNGAVPRSYNKTGVDRPEKVGFPSTQIAYTLCSGEEGRAVGTHFGGWS